MIKFRETCCNLQMKNWEASVLRPKNVLKITVMSELKHHFQTQDHVPKI